MTIMVAEWSLAAKDISCAELRHVITSLDATPNTNRERDQTVGLS
jgi:hypothetical protein